MLHCFSTLFIRERHVVRGQGKELLVVIFFIVLAAWEDGGKDTIAPSSESRGRYTVLSGLAAFIYFLSPHTTAGIVATWKILYVG